MSYPFKVFRHREWCADNDVWAMTGAGVDATADIPQECFLTTMPDGEFYFLELITADEGYHSAPETGAYMGGYGSYKIEAHCGTTGNLSYSDNFTVLTYGEPTQIIDWVRVPINYPAHTAAAIFLIIVLSVFLYWLKEWLS